MPNGDYHEAPLPLDVQVKNLMITNRARSIRIVGLEEEIDALKEENETLKRTIKLVREE